MNQFANPPVRFYRHSGKVSLLGLVLIGIMACMVVPILGLLYGALIRLIPFIYINALLVLGFAFVTGSILASIAKFGKIRNMLLLGVSALFIGLIADYAGWVGWLTVLVGDPAFLIEFLLPFDIMYIITQVAQEGAWTLSGTTPTGGILYFLWFLEAIAVVGGITYVTVNDLAKLPFCEDSDSWASKRTQIGVFAPIPNMAQFRQAVQQGNLSVFNMLRPSLPQDNHFTSLELYECEHCRNFFVLNVDDVTLTTNSKGGTDSKVRSVVSNLLISPIQLANLRKLAQPETTTNLPT